MMFRTTASTLLLLVIFAFTQRLSGQTYYEFMVEVPTMDSANGNQPFSPLNMWISAHPSFTGSLAHSGGYSPSLGIWRDSVYAFGPGTGLFQVNTVDCNGDTVTLTVPMDSTLHMGNTLSDTFFICAPANAVCSDTFTVAGLPGGPTFAFNGSFTGMGGLAVAYYEFGDGVTASGLNSTHTYAFNGSYPVTLHVTLSTGCTASYTQWINVTGALPFCNTSILASQTGNATNFYVNNSGSGSPVSFDWDFDDGQTLSTSTNGIIHAYASSGTYTPCVITTFSDGCIDTTCSTYNITIGSSASCNAWFAYGVSGQTVTLQDSTTSTGAVNTWWWDFGDGTVDSTSGSTVSHTYSYGFFFNVTLEIFTVDTCYDMVTRTVPIPNTNGCLAGFTHAPDTSGQYTILAYNNSIGNNLSYFWDFGDGNSSTQPYPTHQYNGPSTYYVCLAVTQQNPACTDTFCDNVIVNQKQLAAFTFGVWNPATEVTPDPPSATQGLQVYPNPASDRLSIRLPEGLPVGARIQVSNALGQAVMDLPAAATGDMQLDLGPLPDGIYFVRAGQSTGRFLIQR